MPYLRYASWLYVLLVECLLLRELGCVLGLLSFYVRYTLYAIRFTLYAIRYTLYVLLVECLLLRELGCVLGLLSFYAIFFFQQAILQHGPTEQSLKPAIK